MKKLKTFKSTLSLVEGMESRLYPKAPPVVDVLWMDACINTGGTVDYTEHIAKNWQSGALMNTVGFLMGQTKDWITIGMERHAEENNGFRRVQDIPSCAIVKMEFLKQQKV